MQKIENNSFSSLAFAMKAPGAYPYPDPYYRSIFAPYDAQPYPSQPYAGQPMVCCSSMFDSLKTYWWNGNCYFDKQLHA